MIWEFWHVITHRGDKITRAYRFPQELVAMWGRSQRCARAWHPHLVRVKTVICEALAGCAERRKALILGSGLLLDVPLEALARSFQEVILVDMLHLRHVRRQVAAYPNVRLVTLDVSGLLEPLDAAIGRFARGEPLTLPPPMPQAFLEDTEIDLVVSLNLLSQLPILPLVRLEKLRDGQGRPAITPEESLAYGRAMVLAHLEYLQHFAGRVTLLTDVEQHILDGNEKIVGIYGVLYGAPIALSGESWIWKLAPIPESCPLEHIHHRMVAVIDLKGMATTPRADAPPASDRGVSG